MNLYEKESWTIDQLKEYCTSSRERSVSLLTAQQRKETAISRLDMALHFDALSASEDAIRLYGKNGEFIIDKPQVLTAANTGAYMWLCVENASGEAFVLLLHGKNSSDSITGIASDINSVSIEYADEKSGYSFNKSFAHLLADEGSVLLYDTRAEHNNYICLNEIKDAKADENVLILAQNSGERFKLIIGEDAQETLKQITRRSNESESKSIIAEAESLKDRYTALQTLKEWIFNKRRFCAFIDTASQPDNSPFALHEWHLMLHYSDLNERSGKIIFKAGYSNDSRLEIDIASFSLSRTAKGAMLRITDTSGRGYAIEYREEK